MISQINNNYTTPIKFQGNAIAPNTKQTNEKYNLNPVSAKIGDHPFSKFPTSGHYSDLKFSGGSTKIYDEIYEMWNIPIQHLEEDLPAIQKHLFPVMDDLSKYYLKSVKIRKKFKQGYFINPIVSEERIQVEGKKIKLGLNAEPKFDYKELADELEKHKVLTKIEEQEISPSKDSKPKRKRESSPKEDRTSKKNKNVLVFPFSFP